MNEEIEITPRLKELEAIIERGMDTFMEVGTALLEIRDERLYQETHDTFETYCREKWGMSRVHAHRMIKAAEITGTLLPTGNKPKTERQIRPLAGLLPEMAREIWEEAINDANGKDPTAQQVETAKMKIVSPLETENDQPATLQGDLKVGVYRVFEEGNKQINKFKDIRDKRRFKKKLMEFLNKHLIPDYVYVCAIPPLDHKNGLK